MCVPQFIFLIAQRSFPVRGFVRLGFFCAFTLLPIRRMTMDYTHVIAGIGLVEWIIGITEDGKPGPTIQLLDIPLSIKQYQQLPDEWLFARWFDEEEHGWMRGMWKLQGEPRGRALGWVNWHKGPGTSNCHFHRHVLWTPDEVHLYHDAVSNAEYRNHPLLRDLPQLYIGTEEDEEPTRHHHFPA